VHVTPPKLLAAQEPVSLLSRPCRVFAHLGFSSGAHSGLAGACDSSYGQNPCYLSERFPTEVRATASGFCYHQGAIWAGFTGPVLTYFAANQPLGFTVPMLIATSGAAIVFVVTLLLPETRGKEFVPQLTLVAESSAA
jgi:MFS transporter, SHS family, lactate transporter